MDNEMDTGAYKAQDSQEIRPPVPSLLVGNCHAYNHRGGVGLGNGKFLHNISWDCPGKCQEDVVGCEFWKDASCW